MQIARRGKFEAAVEQLQTAQTWNSAVDLDPDTDAVERDPRPVAAKRVALARVETGQRLARQGNVEEAIIAYREALVFDPTIDLDPSTENIQDSDPVAVARQLAAISSLNRGKELAQSRRIEDAILAYQQAQELDLNLEITAEDWEVLCWNGGRHNAAARVLFACDDGLALAPDNKWGWQSRGVARALIDDLVGAAQDLQIVLDWLDSPQAPFLPTEFKDLRQRWLSTLQNLQNPFTPEAIEQVSKSTLPPGEVQVTLDWSAPVDLDLSVVDPNGEEGVLERYSNCAELFPTTTQVDNVLWSLNSSPPPGNYTARVNFDEARGEEAPTSVNFSLNVLIRGQLQTFTGTVSEENPSVEFEFSVASGR